MLGASVTLTHTRQSRNYFSLNKIQLWIISTTPEHFPPTSTGLVLHLNNDDSVLKWHPHHLSDDDLHCVWILWNGPVESGNLVPRQCGGLITLDLVHSSVFQNLMFHCFLFYIPTSYWKDCHPTRRPPVCRSTVNHRSVTAEPTRSYRAFTQRAVGMQRVDSFYVKPNKHVMEIRTEISSREVFLSLFFLKMVLVAATVWRRPEVCVPAQKQAVICRRIRTAWL